MIRRTLRHAVGGARLVRWLGPWSGDDRVPPGIRRCEVWTDRGARPVRMWVYLPPGKARGATILALGLHPLGPEDPRADRLARVIASSGQVVFVPFIPDYQALFLHGQAVDDFCAACAAALGHPACPEGRAGLMSISFGSLLALRAACTPGVAERITGVLTFGAFADVRATLEFAMAPVVGGREVLDDLGVNLPVVYLQVLDLLEDLPADRTPLREALLAFVRGSWDVPEVRRDREAQRALARALAEQLPPEFRDTLLRATTAASGGLDEVRPLVARQDPAPLDPRPWLGALRAPVVVVHGMDDRVIPYTEADKLRVALEAHVPCEVFLTGLFGHTGSEGGAAGAVREAVTLLRMAWRLAGLGEAR